MLLVLDEASVGVLQGLNALVLGRIFVPVEQVVSDGAHDHDGLLTNITNVFAEHFQIKIFNVESIEVHAARSRVVEAFNKLHNCGLA